MLRKCFKRNKGASLLRLLLTHEPLRATHPSAINLAQKLWRVDDALGVRSRKQSWQQSSDSRQIPFEDKVRSGYVQLLNRLFWSLYKSGWLVRRERGLYAIRHGRKCVVRRLQP
jgi:hypothetical protein